MHSAILKAAHARAREDFTWSKSDPYPKPYAYYLRLQMRSGYAEARIARTGICYSAPLGQDRWY